MGKLIDITGQKFGKMKKNNTRTTGTDHRKMLSKNQVKMEDVAKFADDLTDLVLAQVELLNEYEEDDLYNGLFDFLEDFFEQPDYRNYN